MAKQRLRYAADYLPIYDAFCEIPLKARAGNLAPFQQMIFVTINITNNVFCVTKIFPMSDYIHLAAVILFQTVHYAIDFH